MTSLRPLADHGLLAPMLDADGWGNVRQRSLLRNGRCDPLTVLVDDPAAPQASLVFDGRLWDLAAADTARGMAALDAFAFDGSAVSFAGLDEPLAQHLMAQREVRWHTPAHLYGLVELDGLRLPAVQGPLEALTEADLAQVDEAWPHGRGVAGREDYLRKLIGEGPTVGLRVGGELASFALAHADGALGILHTEPEFRQRGLGRQVMAGLIRAVLDRGWPVYGHVMPDNEPSVALVQSVGMRRIRPAHWLGVR